MPRLACHTARGCQPRTNWPRANPGPAIQSAGLQDRPRRKHGMFRARLVHYLLLLAVAALLTLPGLGSVSLWDIDEGLNAGAAREMFESGNWVVPAFNSQPRTAKPALLYWLQATCYRQFGVTEFA